MKRIFLTALLTTQMAFTMPTNAQAVPTPTPQNSTIPSPQLLTAVANGMGAVDLTWSENSGNQGWFRVWYGQSPFSMGSVYSTTSTFGTITGLTPGVIYYFKVQFIAASSMSNTVTVPTPSACQLATNVCLAWDAAPASPAPVTLGYKLYMGPAPGHYNTITDIGLVPGNTFMVTGLTPGSYYFVITAYNNGGESAPSNEVTITLDNQPHLADALHLTVPLVIR